MTKQCLHANLVGEKCDFEQLKGCEFGQSCSAGGKRCKIGQILLKIGKCVRSHYKTYSEQKKLGQCGVMFKRSNCPKSPCRLVMCEIVYKTCISSKEASVLLSYKVEQYWSYCIVIQY